MAINEEIEQNTPSWTLPVGSCEKVIHKKSVGKALGFSPFHNCIILLLLFVVLKDKRIPSLKHVMVIWPFGTYMANGHCGISQLFISFVKVFNKIIFREHIRI